MFESLLSNEIDLKPLNHSLLTTSELIAETKRQKILKRNKNSRINDCLECCLLTETIL